MTQLLLDNTPAPLPPTVTCFSLDQPYAGLVAAGLKTLETRLRPWPEKARPYPSPLLICATMTRRPWKVIRELWRLPTEVAAGVCQSLGVALCLVDVVSCRVLTAEDEPRSWYWDPEEQRKGIVRYAWELANVRRVAPFKVSGRQWFARSVPRQQVEDALRRYGP